MIPKIPTVVKAFLVALLIAAAVSWVLAGVLEPSTQNGMIIIAVEIVIFTIVTYGLNKRWGTIWHSAGRRFGGVVR